MRIGVAYYPEHHEKEQWAGDLELMKQAGIERVRIAEFAWARMEPDEGRYTWEWLDQFIDLAMEHHMEVILCTPSATPPIWLVEKYPEVLPVDEEGRRNVFGARQHRCYNAPAYRESSLRIVEKMAERYGAHPNVVAWQLDNEFGGEQKRCYCDHCKVAFQSHLQQEYTTIDELNERWGTVFWSMEYQRFDQIDPPLKYKADLWLKKSPSIEMAFTRFSSDVIVNYARKQMEIIRQHDQTNPITTNRFSLAWGDNVDWVDLVRDMDVAGFDLYSEKLYEVGFYADFNDSLKPGRSWFLEFGPGASNLADSMNQLQGRGCEWFTIFKFNAFPFGQEQGLKDMVTTTRKPTSAYRNVQKWVQEEQALSEQPETTFPASGIGLYFDFASSWAYTIKTWGAQIQHRMVYPNYVIDVVYQSMFREDRSNRIVYSPDGVAGLDVLLVPLHIIYNPELEQEMLAFVEAGGTLVVTSDLFQKNNDNVFLTELPRIYRELFGMDDFYTENIPLENAVVKHVHKGKGEAIMLLQDATLADWQAVLNQINAINP